MEVARSRGARRLTVTANPHALAFYRSAGFACDDDDADQQTPLGSGPRMTLTLG